VDVISYLTFLLWAFLLLCSNYRGRFFLFDILTVEIFSEQQLFTMTRQVAPGAKAAIDCLVLFVADTDY